MKDKGEEGRREVVKTIKERQGRELKGEKGMEQVNGVR